MLNKLHLSIYFYFPARGHFCPARKENCENSTLRSREKVKKILGKKILGKSKNRVEESNPRPKPLACCFYPLYYSGCFELNLHHFRFINVHFGFVVNVHFSFVNFHFYLVDSCFLFVCCYFHFVGTCGFAGVEVFYRH